MTGFRGLYPVSSEEIGRSLAKTTANPPSAGGLVFTCGNPRMPALELISTDEAVEAHHLRSDVLAEGAADGAAFAGSAYIATDLGPGIANAINDSGYIAGEVTTTNKSSEPVIWSPSGQVTVLQEVGEAGGSQVVGINSAGYAVGYSQIGAPAGTPSCGRQTERQPSFKMWEGKATAKPSGSTMRVRRSGTPKRLAAAGTQSSGRQTEPALSFKTWEEPVIVLRVRSTIRTRSLGTLEVRAPVISLLSGRPTERRRPWAPAGRTESIRTEIL